MRISPERVHQFAHSVRVSLQNADVRPRNVVLRRMSRPPKQLLSSCRHLRGQTSPLQPSRPYSSSFVSESAESLVYKPPLPVTGSAASFQNGPQEARTPPRPLPQTCPGCGALSQRVDAGEAGYYTRSRKAVRTYLRSQRHASLKEHQFQDSHSLDHIKQNLSELEPVERVSRLFPETQHEDSSSVEGSETTTTAPTVPVCDRCHNLIYQSRGVSIAHPSMDAIADSIAESPFRHNHVFHVIDAADFPLSLIPSISKSLSLAKPRSQNRRSQHDFSKRPTMSFIITRSDLLARTKEDVDSLMPYFTSVLRTALGRSAEDIRLGNVHLVSAKRGWWTKQIKDSIWNRGGGNWMVGKVNVGKSNLFEVLFPKGSGERAPSYTELRKEAQSMTEPFDAVSSSREKGLDILSENSLLPPIQPETPYPALPLVSSLPGTTASPIRLSFGKHKGELIDLPGLARGNLETFVHSDHKPDLLMQSRPSVLQHSIKAGQSLLLGGGLVRITPMLDDADPSTTMLAYPFVPIEAHTTATLKAVGTQLQTRESGIKSILAEGTGEKMASAGMFTLDNDVTKARVKPLLAAGVALEKLPFRVYSTDLLIEGVGWVELVCQVRKRRDPPLQYSPPHNPEGDALSHLDGPQMAKSWETTKHLGEFELPRVEVFTPEGKHVGQRRTMGAWMLWNEGQKRRARAATARPRKPMKGSKKREKVARTAAYPAV